MNPRTTQRIIAGAMLVTLLIGIAVIVGGCQQQKEQPTPTVTVLTAGTDLGQAQGKLSSARAATTQAAAISTDPTVKAILAMVPPWLDESVASLVSLSGQFQQTLKSLADERVQHQKDVEAANKRTQAAQDANDAPIHKALGWLVVVSIVGLGASLFCAFYFHSDGAFYGTIASAVMAGASIAVSVLMRTLNLLIPWVVGCVAALLIASVVLLVGLAVYEIWTHRREMQAKLAAQPPS